MDNSGPSVVSEEVGGIIRLVPLKMNAPLFVLNHSTREITTVLSLMR